jgi:hypothetical protein
MEEGIPSRPFDVWETGINIQDFVLSSLSFKFYQKKNHNENKRPLVIHVTRSLWDEEWH